MKKEIHKIENAFSIRHVESVEASFLSMIPALIILGDGINALSYAKQKGELPTWENDYQQSQAHIYTMWALFTVEVGLKHLKSRNGSSFQKIHNLWELFKELEAPVKSRLTKDYGYCVKTYTEGLIYPPTITKEEQGQLEKLHRLGDYLKAYSNAFEEWRYLDFSNKKSTQIVASLPLLHQLAVLSIFKETVPYMDIKLEPLNVSCRLLKMSIPRLYPMIPEFTAFPITGVIDNNDH